MEDNDDTLAAYGGEDCGGGVVEYVVWSGSETCVHRPVPGPGYETCAKCGAVMHKKGPRVQLGQYGRPYLHIASESA